MEHFWDEKLQMAKVGSTFVGVQKRIRETEKACKPDVPFEILAYTAYKRIKRLVQIDLRSHRCFFRCPCGPSKDTRHREYFRVFKEVAIITLDFWTHVGMVNPYEIPSNPTSTTYSIARS
ncbi:hypothetical protein LTR09_007192 [Extremus antarcticus]|uniref:Bacteriophage T5 Orf172 DNA-binding domain-containing protein n=1 Tax=Extremus antarcticus TaxID=702011 RepID=A0AAJ0DJT5_9PEZI|nr:hypothetical protein LTR09_007192 [Extremus antarcticus]